MVLNIEIPYAGLGDHLFHSHLPRIAKETGAYEKVYISTKSHSWNINCMHFVWRKNPYIDGFTDDNGKTCNLKKLIEKTGNRYDSGKPVEANLLDEIMLEFGLDDGERWHEPEVYYKPRFIEAYNKIIYDPNYISYVGEINKEDVYQFFKKNKIYFDAVMKIRSEKALHFYSPSISYIETPTLEDFCDLIFSCKEIHCFTTGTATLSAALRKPTYVYYGKLHLIGLRHSKLHTYRFIGPCVKTKVINCMKSPYWFIKYSIINKLRKHF